MGANCQDCPGEAYFGEEPITLEGFSSDIQHYINSLRETYSLGMDKIRDHKIGDGKLYRGQYLDGKKIGYGQLYMGKNAYFGNFKNDLPDGQGLIVRSFTEYLKCNFTQGLPHGNGKEAYQKMQFLGKYNQGERVYGALVTELYTYEGAFANNKFNGFGKIEFKNFEFYSGEFENGLYHGDGKLETENGTYTGQFKDGLFEGQGVYKWKDGSTYEGEYKNGCRNGYGKLVSGKVKHQGFWVDGKPHKKNSKDTDKARS